MVSKEYKKFLLKRLDVFEIEFWKEEIRIKELIPGYKEYFKERYGVDWEDFIKNLEI